MKGNTDSHDQSVDWSRNDRDLTALQSMSLRGSAATVAIRFLRLPPLGEAFFVLTMGETRGTRIATASVRTGFAMTNYRLHLKLVIAKERSDCGNPFSQASLSGGSLIFIAAR